MFFSILLMVAAPNSPVQSDIQDTTPETAAQLKKGVGAILRADTAEARALLMQIPEQELDKEDRQFRTCALSRLGPFQARIEHNHHFEEALLARYRQYWNEAAAAGADRDRLEDALRTDLANMLHLERSAQWDSVEAALVAALGKRGYHAQLGRTGLLRELMVWRKQIEKREQVDLPGGTTQTLVTYLDDFDSRGWSSWFTCDRTGTGGWTTDEGLFVIVPAYKSLDDEHFRINFLAHESQHFADKARYSGLANWELEYRAKLVEVALADTTLVRVLDGFAANQSGNPDEPHSFANRMVLEALRARLGCAEGASLATVPAEKVKAAALGELAADTDARESADDATP
ncbi:hypothetical protein [Qipengyuania qiaonensis]|uniref:Uncharacterized protein n=1 Tax=Qipengyuania qiaonensis TaxID=2867240 RepID=A0ABS7J4C2_9SPHN|nr:hypothetical protein [Qipengyuania qiaonensis]MBX7482132.1 hypothetical protein [Qipengyuania qiaonensis]